MDTKTMIREVKHVAEKHKNDRKFTGQTVITDMCNDIIPKLEKLAEYETAEIEGRLVVLPCKVGDAVYTIEDKYYEHLYHKGIQKGHVCRFEYDKEWFAWIYIDGCNKDLQIAYKIRNFNKTVFLAREEAEKAMKEKEMESDD